MQPVMQLQEPSDTADYDLSQQTYDLLEMRTFRRDAILQYAVSQRSQQLRILFFASSAVVAAGLPWFTAELFPSLEPFNLGGILSSEFAAVLFGALAAREKSLRGKVLLRLDRELSLASFGIWQPGSAVGGTKRRQMSELRGRRRVVVVSGSPSVLLAELQRASVYKRRLEQSGVSLVFVPTAGSGSDASEAWSAAAQKGEAEGWLWQPTELARWQRYFDELLVGRRGNQGKVDECAWFALTLRGRSCASGVGTLPWDELFGTKLPPLRALQPDDSSVVPRNEDEVQLLAAQSRLYEALSAADSAAVAELFAASDDDEVTKLASAGRLDGWDVVLKYDATVGLVVASQDCCIVDEDAKEGWTTAIEFPASGGGSSLLCTQRWVKLDGGEWRLAQHRTIPYTENVDAAACLRCDHRGCVALQRQGAQGPAGMPGDGRA